MVTRTRRFDNRIRSQPTAVREALRARGTATVSRDTDFDQVAGIRRRRW